MASKPAVVLTAAFLFCASNSVSAQVLQYIGCDVEQAGQAEATITRVFDEMSGGYRPTITLMQNTFNGPNPQTHTILFEHPDYARLQAWAGRIANTPAAQLMLQRTGDNRECNNQGLPIERASWGDRDADWGYVSVVPITTSDAEAYTDLLGELATSAIGESAPGATTLYESRAGTPNTHIVVIQAPDFASLNAYLDTLVSSDDFADFLEEAAEIRLTGVSTQSRRVRTWEP
jgi:hypothetical protein